jgi:hypothetical protein
LAKSHSVFLPNACLINQVCSASFNQQQQMSNVLTDIGTGSRWLIPQETNTSRSVNNSTPHIDINEDQFISQIYHINQNFDKNPTNLTN